MATEAEVLEALHQKTGRRYLIETSQEDKNLVRLVITGMGIDAPMTNYVSKKALGNYIRELLGRR